MPYWITNPDHGTLPVYDMGEVERVKKFGWTLLNVGESPIRGPVVNGDTERAPEDVVEEQKPAEGDGHIEAIKSFIRSSVPVPEPKRKPGRPPKAK
jgi:hypothetical protein